MTKEFENIDLTILNDKWEAAKIASMAARLNNKNYEFQANVLRKQIATKEQKITKSKGMSLNEFLDYIELTLELRPLDPDKLGTGRAYSYYNKAIEKNKRLEEIYKKK